MTTVKRIDDNIKSYVNEGHASLLSRHPMELYYLTAYSILSLVFVAYRAYRKDEIWWGGGGGDW